MSRQFVKIKWNEKRPVPNGTRRFKVWYQLHSTGDLAGTEAAGAHIDVLGSTVNHSLNALDVGLPGTVGAAVGVGNLDTESHALATELTFGHIYKPPRWLKLYFYTNFVILPESNKKIKRKFSKELYFFQVFFLCVFYGKIRKNILGVRHYGV